MRGSKVQGRFKIDFENKSMEEGMVDELRDPVGTTVEWWQWDYNFVSDHIEEVVDDIYDVSSQITGYGRRWRSPFSMPVIMAQQLRGTNVMNERGFYTVDTLRLVVSVADLNRLLPNIVSNPNYHIKDRVVFQNEVFVPTRVLPRGRYSNFYSVVTIDLNLVNGEELVNDPQFLEFAVDASALPPSQVVTEIVDPDGIDGGSPNTDTFLDVLDGNGVIGYGMGGYGD